MHTQLDNYMMTIGKHPCERDLNSRDGSVGRVSVARVLADLPLASSFVDSASAFAACDLSTTTSIIPFDPDSTIPAIIQLVFFLELEKFLEIEKSHAVHRASRLPREF